MAGKALGNKSFCRGGQTDNRMIADKFDVLDRDRTHSVHRPYFLVVKLREQPRGAKSSEKFQSLCLPAQKIAVEIGPLPKLKAERLGGGQYFGSHGVTTLRVSDTKLGTMLAVFVLRQVALAIYRRCQVASAPRPVRCPGIQKLNYPRRTWIISVGPDVARLNPATFVIQPFMIDGRNQLGPVRHHETIAWQSQLRSRRNLRGAPLTKRIPISRIGPATDITGIFIEGD